MKNNKMKALSSTVFTTLLLMAAVPVTATPIYAEEEGEKPLGTITCEVKIHESGYTYTECSGGGYLPDEYVQQVIKETQLAWEQETGYTYGVNIYATPTPEATPVVETPAPVHTCQDDGYPEGYYWSESANACVTDAVAPTPVATPEPTPVPTPVATPEPTLEPVPDPTGGEYHSYVETHYWSDGTPYYCTVSYRDSGTIYRRIPWNNDKGYIIMGEVVKYPGMQTCSPYNTDIPASRPIPTRTPYPDWTPTPRPTATPKPTSTPKPTPTSTPKPTQKPTVKPTSTPTATPTPTPVASAGTWDYAVVGDKVLALINEQRVASGLKPLTVLAQANTDATQRANESMEFAKSITAYGTATDRHVGFDTEIGDIEVNSYVSHLDSDLTAEEVANMIFNSMTSGLMKSEAPFSDQYKTIGLGFVDAHFTSRYGRDLGHNVWFNLQLNK